jgi:hypothetical protein
MGNVESQDDFGWLTQCDVRAGYRYLRSAQSRISCDKELLFEVGTKQAVQSRLAHVVRLLKDEVATASQDDGGEFGQASSAVTKSSCEPWVRVY